VWIEKIAVCLYGDARSGDCAVAGNSGFQEGAHNIPRALAQFAEQGAVVYEIDPQALGYAEDPVPVRNFLKDLCQKPFAVFDDPLLVARGAKMAALARKRQEIFMAAIVASNPGEAASQVAAVQIPVNHVRYIWSPESVPGRVQIVPNRFQFLEMVFHAVVEGRFPGFARLVDPGDVFVRFRHGESPFGRNARLRIKTKRAVSVLYPFYCM
jgi:hypothetical protein